jgi:cytoskeletal protein RodZ
MNPFGRKDPSNMHVSRKPLLLALIASLLLLAGNLTLRAVSKLQDPQSTDQGDATTKAKKTTDDATAGTSASTTKKSTRSKKSTTAADAPAAAATTPAASTPTPSTPAKTTTTPPANSNGMVWVNIDSGVYHKPGTRYYGKTKQGKYMTEADAIKAGYRAAEKN